MKFVIFNLNQANLSLLSMLPVLELLLIIIMQISVGLGGLLGF